MPPATTVRAVADRHGRELDLRRGPRAEPALQRSCRVVRVLGRDPELARRQLDTGPLELAHERRPDAGRLQGALDLAVAVPGLDEAEDVLGEDLVVLDPVDLGDVDDLARAVLEPRRVDDEVDGRGDLLADRPQRQLVAGHEDHRLEAPEHVLGAVGVAGRQRAVVAGRHRLEHVQRLARAALADDDPVGSHVHRVPQQVPDRDLALAFEVGRPRLERDDVVLAELELGGVLDRHDPLVVRDERRQDVERRGLAGPGATGHEQVEPRLDARVEEVEHRRAWPSRT